MLPVLVGGVVEEFGATEVTVAAFTLLDIGGGGCFIELAPKEAGEVGMAAITDDDGGDGGGLFLCASFTS